MLQYFIRLFNMLSFTFLLLQKRNKKGAPKSITSRFREGALIKLLHYCKLRFSSLMYNSSIFLNHFISKPR